MRVYSIDGKAVDSVPCAGTLQDPLPGTVQDVLGSPGKKRGRCPHCHEVYPLTRPKGRDGRIRAHDEPYRMIVRYAGADGPEHPAALPAVNVSIFARLGRGPEHFQVRAQWRGGPEAHKEFTDTLSGQDRMRTIALMRHTEQFTTENDHVELVLASAAWSHPASE